MVYFALCFILLSAALMLTAFHLLRIPGYRSGQRFKTAVRKKRNSVSFLLEMLSAPLVRPVASLLPMKPSREAELAGQLRRVGLDIHPRDYYARALLAAMSTLLLSPLIAFIGLPQASPAAVILAVIVFFHFTTMHKDALKAKQERIELGLPGFIRSILDLS